MSAESQHSFASADKTGKYNLPNIYENDEESRDGASEDTTIKYEAQDRDWSYDRRMAAQEIKGMKMQNPVNEEPTNLPCDSHNLLWTLPESTGRESNPKIPDWGNKPWYESNNSRKKDSEDEDIDFPMLLDYRHESDLSIPEATNSKMSMKFKDNKNAGMKLTSRMFMRRRGWLLKRDDICRLLPKHLLPVRPRKLRMLQFAVQCAVNGFAHSLVMDICRYKQQNADKHLSVGANDVCSTIQEVSSSNAFYRKLMNDDKFCEQLCFDEKYQKE